MRNNYLRKEARMASKKIKIGIAGIGRAGWGMHCPELDHYKELYEIVAAGDIEADRKRWRGVTWNAGGI